MKEATPIIKKYRHYSLAIDIVSVDVTIVLTKSPKIMLYIGKDNPPKIPLTVPVIMRHLS